MARLNQSTQIQTERGERFKYALSEDYREVFNIRREVDSSDGFITLVTPSTTMSEDAVGGEMSDVICLVVKNYGLVGAEVQFKITSYSDNSDVDDYSAVQNISFLLAANEYIFFPNTRWVGYNADNSGGNAKPTTSGAYLTLDSNEYVDSGANVDDGSGLDIIGSATETKVFLEPWTSVADCTANLFHIGDLIRVNNEIMEVTAIGDKSTLANNYLTVIRGVHGSTAASDHADAAAIRLPFFNAYHNFTAATGGFDTVQTNKSGRFKAMNFFGYGRVEDSTASGIVPGSIAGKFYNAGYQEIGMSGITGTANSGLAASTEYAFDIQIDASTAFNCQFTTDASNLNFGGTNGIVAKIQTILDAEYYNKTSNIFEKRVYVSIRGGDIRFTSGQRLSTSAIALAVKTGGDNEFFNSGRIPAIGKVETSVDAQLPLDTFLNKKGITVPNSGVFFYDDGHGNIRGTASGSINYESGAIDITGPPNAHFTITANYDSAHGGGTNTGTAVQNVISQISARSCNSKVNVPIEVVAFN